MGLSVSTASVGTPISGELFEQADLAEREPKYARPNESVSEGIGQRRILVVEDDIPLSRFLGRELRSKLFAVEVSTDAESACDSLARSSYDLVILDLNLPNMDGIEFLGRMREMDRQRFPVLVLTARTRTEDVIHALDHGADDFLVKPFSFLELLARIRSLLRRPAPIDDSGRMSIDSLRLNRAEHRVTRGERRIDLTPREFAILEHMMSNVGRPVSRAGLMRDVWNLAFDPSTNIVDVYMKYLRDKIDGEGEAKLIHTVRGVGYVLRQE